MTSGLLAATLAGGTRAHADPPLPVQYVLRPLTLPHMTLTLVGNGVDDHVQGYTSALGTLAPRDIQRLGLGAGYGLTDDLEVSVTLFSIEVSPAFQNTDVSFESRYRFLRGGVEMALAFFVASRDPVAGPSGLGLGVPMLIRVGDVGRFDVIPAVVLTDPGPTLDVPIFYEHQLSENVGVGLHTGVTLPDLRLDRANVPLGVVARFATGFTSRRTLVEAVMRFDFGRFYTAGQDTVDVGDWTVQIAGRVYFLL